MVKGYFLNRGVDLTDDEAAKVERVAFDLLAVHPFCDPLDVIYRAIAPPNKGLQADELRRLAKSQSLLRKILSRLVGWFSATLR